MHVDAVAPAAPEHLEAAVHQTLAVHARADADLVQQIDADLLEHAGADAAEHVVAASARSTITASMPALRQELPEQQARGAGADDGDLGSRVGPATLIAGHAISMPWRASASVAAGEAMKPSSARAASGCARARADGARERGDDLDRRRQRPEHVDAVDVHQLRCCWKPSSTSPRATSVPTGMPGGGVTIRSRDSLGDAPALEQLARARRRSGRWR